MLFLGTVLASPTAVPAEGNGDLQTLICVLVARPRQCLILSNLVPWQNWMAAYLGYTLRMKTLFRGWPVMAHETHTRRRRITRISSSPLLLPGRGASLINMWNWFVGGEPRWVCVSSARLERLPTDTLAAVVHWHLYILDDNCQSLDRGSQWPGKSQKLRKFGNFIGDVENLIRVVRLFVKCINTKKHT